MTRISPYIHFNGNAEEAFTFYKSAFDGEFARIARSKDMAALDNLVSEKKMISRQKTDGVQSNCPPFSNKP